MLIIQVTIYCFTIEYSVFWNGDSSLGDYIMFYAMWMQQLYFTVCAYMYLWLTIVVK